MPPILPPSSAQLFDTPIFNAQVPSEGPKGLGVVAPFTVDTPVFEINLLLTQSQRFMSGVQSVFVDNSQNGSDVTINCQTLNQNLTIPSNSQAYLPLLVAKNDVLTVSSIGEVSVSFIFCNIPLPAAVWNV